MFKKLLIANRGEIACRIIKTAQQMGIHCIAVYSEADKHARFVAMADEAWLLGPAEAKESYLRADKILEIAKTQGAEAIHPGYGFLSENAEFARLCKQSGIVFVGPAPEAIEAMGSKSAAKALMASANVPLVPGYHGEDQQSALLEKEADKIGYPVLLKASAGGGGKGMRIVSRAEDFSAAFTGAKREALSSFGDDRILVEKFIVEPRHVEVQILCDNHGNAVYVHDRDCSIQRRHQKVIEEAPAPGLSVTVRKAMGEAALACAKAINYTGVGTIEFLLDVNESFYFMEMNTRLQVEHPVTECISGLDLVEWQLRVAANEQLDFTQTDIPAHGHAFEARIYAESPLDQFLPASGTITHLHFPAESQNTRIDTGVQAKDEISSFYDPMIAKLIVWGESRQQALSHMTQALQQTRIGGLSTNVAFLGRIFQHPEFADARLSTLFIEEHQHTLLQPPTLGESLAIQAGIAHVCLHYMNRPQKNCPRAVDIHSPWCDRTAWRLNEPGIESFELLWNDTPLSFKLHLTAPSGMDTGLSFTLQYESVTETITASLDNTLVTADFGHHKIKFIIEPEDTFFTLYKDGQPYAFENARSFGTEAKTADEHGLTAPMHGKVIEIFVKPGQSVKQGDRLMIMEAMKMEHTISAHEDGDVHEIFYTVGDMVAEGALLIDLKPEQTE